MILVTVGTTMPFPQLLHEVDSLAGKNLFEGHEIFCQTGKSDLDLENCKTFAFSSSLDKLIDEAELVITHGGSTVFSLIRAKKQFIAFPNPLGADQHQHTLLRKLEKVFPILWSPDVKDLEKLYREAISANRPDIELPSLADELARFLLED